MSSPNTFGSGSGGKVRAARRRAAGHQRSKSLAPTPRILAHEAEVFDFGRRGAAGQRTKAGSGLQRARSNLRSHGGVRRRSLPNARAGFSESSADELLLSDSEMRPFQRVPSTESMGAGGGASGAPTAPGVSSPAGSTIDGAVPGSGKLDLSVEFKVHIEHGRCCLHALPRSALDSGPIAQSPGVPPPVSSLLSEDVYADFILPSISCTSVLSSSSLAGPSGASVPREEILVLLDLSAPPVVLNPSILLFAEEVAIELEKIKQREAQAQANAAAEGTTATTEAAAAESLAAAGMASATADTAQSPRGMRRNAARGVATPAPSATAQPASTSSAPLSAAAATGNPDLEQDTPQYPSPSESSTAPSALSSFLSACASAGRSITLNVRLRHTLLKLNCMPVHEGVVLQFGSKRSIDLCISVAQLDQARLGLPVAVPYISATVNVPSLFLQLASSDDAGVGGSTDPTSPSHAGGPSLGSGGAPFLDVRCRHAKLHIFEAYNVRADQAPIRTVLFHMDSVSPALVSISSISTAVVFCKTWAAAGSGATKKPAAAATAAAPSTTSTAGGSTDDKSQALVPVSRSPSSSGAASSASTAVAKYTSNRASLYYFSLGLFETEANMFDVSDVANRCSATMSRMALRVLDVGGTFPAGCYPLMATLSTRELAFVSEPELDGLDGSFLAPKGMRIDFARLPLSSVQRSDFDFFRPTHPLSDDEEEDAAGGEGDQGDGAQEDRVSEDDRAFEDDDERRSEFGGSQDGSQYSSRLNDRFSERSWSSESVNGDATDDLEDEAHDSFDDSRMSRPRRRSTRRSRSRSRSRAFGNGGEEVSAPPVPLMMSRRRKRMVNLMALSLSASTARFSLQHGRVQLVSADTAPLRASLLDWWEERQGVGFLQRDGDWAVRLALDLGERLKLEASSRAAPYALEMLAALLKFVQTELGRVRLHRLHALRHAVVAARTRREVIQAKLLAAASAAQSAREPLASAGTRASPDSAGNTTATRLSRLHATRDADPYHINAPMATTRSATPTVQPVPDAVLNAPPAPAALVAGLFSVHGRIVELRLSSAEDLGRELTLVEVVELSVSLARQPLFSEQQIKEQQMLLELRRKRVQIAQHQHAVPQYHSAHRDSIVGLMPMSPTGGGPSLVAVAAGGPLSPHGLSDPFDVSHIRTEEELSVALALVDEEDDPLRRLAKRSSQTLPYRGGLLQPFVPLDLHRTLLLDVGGHYKLEQPETGNWLWQVDPAAASASSAAARLSSRVGATGPGVYVSRLTQARLGGVDSEADELDHALRVPAFVLEMETLDALQSPRLQARFQAQWDKSITVSLDVRLYKFLQQMLQAFTTRVEKAKAQVQRQRLAAEAQAAALRSKQEEEQQQQQQQEAATSLVVSSAEPVGPSPLLRSAAAAAAEKARTVRFRLEAPKAQTGGASVAASALSPPSADTPQSSRTPPPPESIPRGSPGSSAVAAAAAVTSPQPGHGRSASERVRDSSSLSAASLAAPSSASAGSSPARPLTPASGGSAASPSPTAAATSPSSAVPPAPRLEKEFERDFFFDLGNPQLHVLDSSASGIGVKKILDLWDSLSSDKQQTADRNGGTTGSGSGATYSSASLRRGGVGSSKTTSKEEQVIPAATHRLTMALDALLLSCADASRAIDRMFEG